MRVRLLVPALLLVALAAPPTALAQSAFGPLPQPAPETQPQRAPAAAPDDDDEGGLSRTQEILIALGGIALLVGIGWAIVRDARFVAPEEDRPRPATGEAEHHRGTRPPRRSRVASSRAKAKAARRDRKRNTQRRSRRRAR